MENNDKNSEIKSLRWLANQFPWINEPRDNCDKMSNAIHIYATNGADKIEELQRKIDRLTALSKQRNEILIHDNIDN